MNTPIDKDIFMKQNDKLLVNMEEFYDNLTILNNGQECHREKSKLILENCIEKCEEALNNNLIVVFKKNGIGKREFKSLDEFKKWLYNDCNERLGIKNVKYNL
ncbi:hypothetical protein ACJDU8_17075 [Clostridium sp. WILCCON 0269]|uniref:Uncharacterized protein n=1 Tax=Candidatus Clostridium eludens TaxID=3381663 RepID=A0ABW8SPZ6_9CLOT